jgi:hypothetical protein
MPFISSTRGTFGAQGKALGKGKIIATGGAITTPGIYKVHTFTSDGTFTVTSAPAGSTIDLLMVGAGGGAGSGGNCSHGGGGAGGLVYRTAESITAGSYAIVIGTGGIGCTADGVSPKANAGNGNNTTFKGLTALGGGGANCGPYNVRNANDGGSGGGGQHSDTGLLLGGNALQPGSASGGFGFKGGEGPLSGSGSPCWYGGGGGGAGAAGTNGLANSGGEGGIGRQYDISGTSTYYAGGGGGGGCNSSCTDKAGGLGGGGTGRGQSSSGNGENGTDGLGGGGGAVAYATNGIKAGNGGKGVVIVRYLA